MTLRKERRRSSANEIPNRAASRFAASYSSSLRLIWVRIMITSYRLVLSSANPNSQGQIWLLRHYFGSLLGRTGSRCGDRARSDGAQFPERDFEVRSRRARGRGARGAWSERGAK